MASKAARKMRARAIQRIENDAGGSSIRVGRRVTELQDLVLAERRDPETRSSVAGVFRRRLVNIKTAIIGKDDETVLEKCGRGEDSTARNYRKALAKSLPANIHLVVERQYQAVPCSYDQIKQLREQIKTSLNLKKFCQSIAKRMRLAVARFARFRGSKSANHAYRRHVPIRSP